MQVNSSIEMQQYLEKIAAKKLTTDNTQAQETTGTSFFNQMMDAYIPSTDSSESGEDGLAIPSEQYNDMRSMMNASSPPPMPPMPPVDETQDTDETEETSETESTDTTSDSDDILSTISSTMRVSEDSIKEAMEELGITTDDLTNEDSLNALLEKLNQGAEDRGLKTVSESTIETLIAQLIENATQDTTETAGETVDETTAETVAEA